MDRILKLTCLFIVTLTCCDVSVSQENTAQPTGSCDYGMIMKVVAKLEKRVEALEAENQQQRTEIAELKTFLQPEGKNDMETTDEASVVHASYQDIKPDHHKKYRIQRASPEVTIAFYASLQNPVSHLGQGQNIRFDNVVTNIGNTYDLSAGIFRAPVAGVYVFSTTVLTNGRDTTHYGFALNGKTITVLYVHGAESAYDADSQTIILQLRSGDDVSVQHIGSDKSLFGNNHSVFSGFLLSESQEGTSIIG